MKICEKSACSFPNWFPLFKNITISAEYEQIPDDVLQYLKDDGVTIPREALIEKVKSSYIDDITYTDWDSDGEDDDEVTLPTFPVFSNRLRNVMKKFGGSVFIKLNWSAPTDAAWIATNNCLKCCNLQDIYLLLKSSDKIANDLDATAVSLPNKFYIVMKKWEDIHPGSEFRCFVSDRELIAITQRDNVFSDLNTDTYLFTRSELEEMIYEEGISPEFRYIGEDVGIQPVNMDRHFGLPREFSEVDADKSRSLIELLQTQVQMQNAEEN
ncbi:hypothetical protein O3M35_010047 [Rhynocoris fuscipes]|uniref:Cell division cycle protein 123 homolog n=1 Tax=Rhynocoris fuscipes TaxID=488301 RepID=A0AAW1D3P4_9HEMI